MDKIGDGARYLRGGLLMLDYPNYDPATAFVGPLELTT